MTKIKSAIPRAPFRVLLVLLEEQARGRIHLLTLRKIAERLEWYSTNYVFICLNQLKHRGLIDWQPNKAGTLRCRCTLERT